MKTVQINTKSGPVCGSVEQGIRVFRGIPYARPPVGPLRWCPPRDPEPWEEPLDCLTYGPNPMQPDYDPEPAYAGEFEVDRSTGYSEDCLYLNVWSAEDPYRNKPVIVFLFGGGFVIGSANTPAYEGHALADKGAVYVSVNFRIGPFGFLVHPDLRAEQGTSGNYAILDIIQALTWVHDNIAAFGGDPGNVTLMGISSGGCCAEYVALSPKASGLVRRVAVMSYLQIHRPAPDMIGMEKRIEAEAGRTLLSDLRDLPPEKVLERFADVSEWGPCVDGSVIPFSTKQQYEYGLGNNFDLLLSCVAGDAPMASGLGRVDMLGFAAASEDRYRICLQRAYGSFLAEKMLEYYPGDDEQRADSIFRLKRDELMALSFATAKWKSKHRAGNTYLCHNAYPYPGRDLGAYHGSDIPFWLGTLPSSDPEAQRLSGLLQTYLLNFARTGDPNGPGLPEWGAYDGTLGFLDIPADLSEEIYWIGTINDYFWEHYAEDCVTSIRRS